MTTRTKCTRCGKLSTVRHLAEGYTRCDYCGLLLGYRYTLERRVRLEEVDAVELEEQPDGTVEAVERTRTVRVVSWDVTWHGPSGNPWKGPFYVETNGGRGRRPATLRETVARLEHERHSAPGPIAIVRHPR